MNAQPNRFSFGALLLIFVGLALSGCVKEVSPPTEEQVDAVRAASLTLMRPAGDAAPAIATPTYRPPSVREAAAMALARIGEPAVPALIETLNDRDPKVRAAAAMALARIGSQAKAAIPALTKALKDKDPSVRREAARALGQMGPVAQEAVPALLEALRDPGSDTIDPDTGSST